MISVIAPCLNEERHIGFFMESLTAQNYFLNFEVILVDGGSKDKTHTIVDSYDSFLKITKLVYTVKNLGLVRNHGAKVARGEILLFTNSDAVLPRGFLHSISSKFEENNLLAALSGRTIPWEGGLLCSFAYGAFDLLRWMFSKIGRFSPSGNFLAVRSEVFWAAGGFPNVKINEDGLLGARLEGRKEFDLDLWTGHFADRWNGQSWKTLKFYSYVFGNFNAGLKKVLSGLEKRSSGEFDRK